MPQPKRSTRSRVTAAAKSRGRKVVGPKAIGRLEKSLDAAEVALKDLRKELGRGGNTMVKDFERALKDSRKNLTTMSRTVTRDLEKLQKAATKGRSPRKSTSSRSTSTRRSATAKRSTSSRSRSTSSRSRSTGGSRATKR